MEIDLAGAKNKLLIASWEIENASDKMTAKNLEDFIFIGNYLQENKWHPSRQELIKEFDVSSGNVVERLNSLQSIKLIEIDEKNQRIKLTPFGEHAFSLFTQTSS
ncbi:MAG TPA: hypothetical protein VG895_01980 [Patescibacteria group bacterium]|nr:hypothetical protein [Patescibacteria group bacterium]